MSLFNSPIYFVSFDFSYQVNFLICVIHWCFFTELITKTKGLEPHEDLNLPFNCHSRKAISVQYIFPLSFSVSHLLHVYPSFLSSCSPPLLPSFIHQYIIPCHSAHPRFQNHHHWNHHLALDLDNHHNHHVVVYLLYIYIIMQHVIIIYAVFPLSSSTHHSHNSSLPPPIRIITVITATIIIVITICP